jgi:hypothetical protein
MESGIDNRLWSFFGSTLERFNAQALAGDIPAIFASKIALFDMTSATTDFVRFLKFFILLTNFLEKKVSPESQHYLPLRSAYDYQIVTFSLSHLDFLFDCFARAISPDTAQEAQNVILTLISRIVTNPSRSVIAAFVAFFDRARLLGPIAKTRVLGLILSYIDKTEDKVILADFFLPRHKAHKQPQFIRKIYILFNDQTFSLSVDPYEALTDVKKRIARIVNIHYDRFWLTDAKGDFLKLVSTVLHAGIEDGAILTVNSSPGTVSYPIDNTLPTIELHKLQFASTLFNELATSTDASFDRICRKLLNRLPSDSNLIDALSNIPEYIAMLAQSANEYRRVYMLQILSDRVSQPKIKDALRVNSSSRSFIDFLVSHDRPVRGLRQ